MLWGRQGISSKVGVQVLSIVYSGLLWLEHFTVPQQWRTDAALHAKTKNVGEAHFLCCVGKSVPRATSVLGSEMPPVAGALYHALVGE